jgi:hypothetical protein
VDEDGLIKIAAADESRFDHDPVTGECLGLLVEEQRSNLVTYSESFDSWTTGNVDVGINTTTAPDGTQNAESLIERDQNYSGGAYRRNNVTIGSAYSGQLSYSVFLKSAEVTTVGLIIDIPELGDPRANVNLTSSTTSGSGTNSTYKVESFLNGWKRVSVTSTNSLSDYTGTFAVGIYLNGYVGFDNTGNYGDKVYVWGAQLEAGAFPTSYIPRPDASTATRNPDSVSMIGDNFSDWYNQSEGSVRILAKTNRIYSGSNQFPYSMQIDDGTGSNRIAVDNGVLSSTIRQLLSVWENGSSVGNNLGNLQNVNGLPCAFAYKTNDLAFVNGAGTLFTDDNAPIATTMNRLQIGSGSGGRLGGTISKLSYYPTRLTNAQLQNLTK